MDPNETYKLWKEADYFDEAISHGMALKKWIDNGGFEPTWEDNESRLFFMDWFEVCIDVTKVFT